MISLGISFPEVDVDNDENIEDTVGLRPDGIFTHKSTTITLEANLG